MNFQIKEKDCAGKYGQFFTCQTDLHKLCRSEKDSHFFISRTNIQTYMSDSVFYAEVYYSGRVQGVGFRYHTFQIAKEFEVSGYVRNLPDGRVQLEAEGVESEVMGFQQEIEKQLKPFIRDVETRAQVRLARFKGFDIL